MVSILKIYKFFLQWLLKLVARLSPRTIEIEPGTALAFAKDYSVYVLDFLFFGGSITDKSERSVKFQAECVAKGLRQLGVQKCTLVGFSYGGMVGFRMGEMFPDLVESMVVTGSVMAMTESITHAGLERIGFSRWADYLLPVSAKGVETLFQVACYRFPKLPNWFYNEMLHDFNNYRVEKGELLNALVISDQEFTIPCYQQSIHLLWGENDKIIDLATAQNIKRQVEEKASLEYIEKSGHIARMERPLVYNNHLRKILASLSLKYHIYSLCVG
ncbi:Alpha/beta hydrolase-1 [Corchorus capsularis]|uniref:Alpha/beta hydrolase-1 n=1 Tax=Corchorus capsularis TaxID=210143 RepID=A0A1R3K6V1_COCAP|nr:Alpha/beta hydrolase-1 [Corchorus capsularis]